MGFEVGQRVIVLPGVSNCVDEGSKTVTRPLGVDRSHLVGKRGEVVEVKDGMVLVDDQINHSKVDDKGQPTRSGPLTMREWFKESEVKPG